MNYNSLVFRKDMTGVDEYVRWSAITSDLMRAYLYSKRSIIDGVSYIFYDGELIPEKKVLDAFNRFFGLYQKYLERGYNIDKIGSNAGTYSLGSFQDDYENCDFISSDFSSYACNPPKEQFSMSDGTIVIETYENGSIVRDLQNDTEYFYSNKDVEFLRRFREFPLELDIVASINEGILHRREKYDIVDGLESNRLSSNLVKVCDYQSKLNRYSVGYSILKQKLPSGRCEFIPEFWYKGRCYIGRHCDNEPEAICEAYKLENSVASSDRKYLFNPINFHRNHKHLLEKYVRGEITELGLLRDILTDVAKNPFLILRYNLVDLCRKYCIYISPFQLDNEGFMINFNGTRYVDLADKYMSGVLSEQEIATQSIL